MQRAKSKSAVQNPGLRSWAEIDTKAFKHNLAAFRKVAGKGKLMAVVKSNAYGHGIMECTKIFEQAGATWLGVDDIDEALTLRRAGLKLPILVLGYTMPGRFPEAVKHNISVTIASIEALKQSEVQKAKGKIAVQNPKLKIHLKLETGLNRQGIAEGLLASSCRLLVSMQKEVKVEGVYSHFAAAELATEAKYKKYCDLQMDNFERMSGQAEKALGHKLIKHMADTAAAVWLPRSRYDLVRIGIGLYGLDPTSKVDQKILNKVKLKPALSWYSIIAQVKQVKKGEPIGYNLTERAAKDSQIAIVPVGYWHGYSWSLSNKGEVLVHGKRCKVAGRVCMDMMIVDVTKVPNAKAGDIVTLIGKGLSAEEVATKAGTINYELVTRINSVVKRFWI